MTSPHHPEHLAQAAAALAGYRRTTDGTEPVTDRVGAAQIALTVAAGNDSQRSGHHGAQITNCATGWLDAIPGDVFLDVGSVADDAAALVPTLPRDSIDAAVTVLIARQAATIPSNYDHPLAVAAVVSVCVDRWAMHRVMSHADVLDRLTGSVTA